MQKAVKKALHRLKSRGVIFNENQAPRHVVLGGAASRLERCLASFIDGYRGPHDPDDPHPTGVVAIRSLIWWLNYGTGIRFAKALQISRRELPEMLESVQAQAPLIDLDPAHCQRQIALVQQMNLATRTPVPEEFFTLRDLIGEPETTPETGAIYEGARPGRTGIGQSPGRPRQRPAVESAANWPVWTLPESAVRTYADALAEIDESKIVVSEAMQA